MAKIPPCPVCGKRPLLTKCEPWPRSLKPQPWYCGCYGTQPREHHIGENGDTKGEAIAAYAEAARAQSGEGST